MILDEILNNAIKALNIIKTKKSNCKKCDNGRVLNPNHKHDPENVFADILKYTACDCLFHEGKEEHEYETIIINAKGKIDKIKNLIPEIYRDIDLSCIDPRIANFINSKKTFLWIFGKPGTGKTYSINALSIKKIIDTNSQIKIVKEYDFDYKKIDEYKRELFCIDDFGLSENTNRNTNLLDLYFELIDYKLENFKKLIITSNLSISEWVEKMKKYNYETVIRIASRFSNETECVELTGNDRRKIKTG